ncbi:MAG: TrkA C-terminal domain-containing protein [Fibrobacteria bacterium]|nr:TrkA C-terminal domain-containing protein [Fibrobacteria bacterium]
MVALVSLVVVLAISIILTRIATVALIQTGLSEQVARFQARSALTGVGFTTREAENVVNHPVRRRILMFLMLMGNAGLITVVSSLILTFVNASGSQSFIKMGILVLSVLMLWLISYSKWLERYMSRFIHVLLRKFTKLDVRDYKSLLRVGGEYQVMELQVQPGDWLEGKTLKELRLTHEGIFVLGIEEPDGNYLGVPISSTCLKAKDILVLYGREANIKDLDNRKPGISGALEHQDAIIEQRKIIQEVEQTTQGIIIDNVEKQAGKIKE